MSDFLPKQASGELTLRPNAISAILLKNANRSLARQRRVCKAKGCGLNTVDYPNEKLFAFPVDPKRNKVWCDIAEFVADESMGGYFMLCKRHFKKSSFRDSTQRNLKYRHNPCYKTGPLNPITGDYCPVGQEEPLKSETSHVSRSDMDEQFSTDEESAVLVVGEHGDINEASIMENANSEVVVDDRLSFDSFPDEIIVGEPLNANQETEVESDSDGFSDNWMETALNPTGRETLEEYDAFPDVSSEFEISSTPLASICVKRNDQLSSEREILFDELNKKRQGIITRLNRLISAEQSIARASANQGPERKPNFIRKTDVKNSSLSANRVHSAQTLNRRWTTRLPPRKKRKKIKTFEKIKADLLMVRSSRNYRLLKSTLVQLSKGKLPLARSSSRDTTGKQFRTLPSTKASPSSVMNYVFRAVEERMSNNDNEQYAYCALLWDKIPINGYQAASPDLLADSPDDVTYALVFMVVGIFCQWCQPLAYYFMSNDQGASAIADIVRQIIIRCNKSGLRVKATVCDWTIQNRMAYARLGVSNRQQWFLLNGVRVSCLYDPQRLILQTRNMFREFDFVTRTDLSDDGTGVTSTAKWSDIVQVVAEDKKNSIRLMRKLTESHLKPFGQSANKIELAAQVFSDTVAASIETLARYGVLEARVKATAFVTMFFNRLFDSLTGVSPYPDGGGGLRCRLQADREHFHFAFWKNASSLLAQMKLVSHDPKTIPQPKSWQANGWIATMDGMRSLWTDLRVELPYLTYLELCRFNLGPLEWLFDAVRIYWNPEDPNEAPSAQEFSSTLESCMRRGIDHSFSGNKEFVYGSDGEFEIDPGDLDDSESTSDS